ncbi:hypothetical protein [Prosthecobacter sp.]|uniref:hypothetical protein n=1 Tax=Prosthecobacter sp. TaxID=1965333 RepID=UPI0037850D1E
MMILAAWMLAGGRSIAKEPKPSEVMKLILAYHKSTTQDLDVKGLPQDKTMTELFASKMPECEVHEIPFPAGVEDAFSYKIYLHRPSGRYWIFREGGFGGVREFYGPGLVKDLRR